VKFIRVQVTIYAQIKMFNSLQSFDIVNNVGGGGKGSEEVHYRGDLAAA
jgi:hypothetical protein